MAKASAGKRSAGKSSAAKKAVTRPPRKEVIIRYETAPDYRHMASSGSLVRAERNAIVVTHYIEEMMPTTQVARLKQDDGEHALKYELGDLEEEPRRLVFSAVRLDLEQAASLATLILEKVHSIRPDLLPNFDQMFQDTEKKK